MTSTVITGIGELVTCDGTGDDRLGTPAPTPPWSSTDGLIAWIGPAAARTGRRPAIDLDGRALIPGFVDSHSHLVFAGDRSAEFAARMTGTPYDGGGIATHHGRHPSRLRRRAPRRWSPRRVAEMRAQGTTTVEIKSGYGLSVADEARALRIAARVHRRDDLPRRPRGAAGVAADRTATSTWSPARCWPPRAVRPLDRRVLRAGVAVRLHRRRGPAVLEAGRAAGLELRVHGNQLGPGPGRPARRRARRRQCRPLHLPVRRRRRRPGRRRRRPPWPRCCPGVEFCTRSPYPDGRRLIDAGVSIALATDCNPGTCYSSSMPFMIALAVREMGLTPAEALFAATAGSARSLRRDDIGRIAVGARADLAVLDAPTYLPPAYRPGVPIARDARPVGHIARGGGGGRGRKGERVEVEGVRVEGGRGCQQGGGEIEGGGEKDRGEGGGRGGEVGLEGMGRGERREIGEVGIESEGGSKGRGEGRGGWG